MSPLLTCSFSGNSQKLKGFHDPDDEFLDDDNTKRVGDRLSDITTRKVIVVRRQIVTHSPSAGPRQWRLTNSCAAEPIAASDLVLIRCRGC